MNGSTANFETWARKDVRCDTVRGIVYNQMSVGAGLSSLVLQGDLLDEALRGPSLPDF